jgi:hypothetical protein
VSCAHAEVGWKSECGEAEEQHRDPRSFLVDRSLWSSEVCTVVKDIICVIYISRFFPFQFSTWYFISVPSVEFPARPRSHLMREKLA